MNYFVGILVVLSYVFVIGARSSSFKRRKVYFVYLYYIFS